MQEFKKWCGMPSVHGAQDCWHITILKLKWFPEEDYYYKQGGFTIVAQCIVDYRKHF